MFLVQGHFTKKKNNREIKILLNNHDSSSENFLISAKKVYWNSENAFCILRHLRVLFPKF